MSLRQLLKKQGGLKLIAQYFHNGLFFTALGEFLLLQGSRTGLEILRLSTQMKIKQKLEKKYKNKLVGFDKRYSNSLLHESSNNVWVCWFQGMDYAPVLVRKCYQSLQEHLTDRQIVLITAQNMADYVQFPTFILDKWEKGTITDTHMTDLLRLELLIRYGGMWLDATVLCTSYSKDIPHYFFDSDLFLYQCLKPGRDGHSHLISSWLISAKTNNKILMAVLYLCYEYWKENTEQIDYFLLHDFISIVLEYYPNDWKKIMPRDNATPHILLLRLFDHFDEELWKSIKEQTPFHKMTYKFENVKAAVKNTYYSELFLK